MGTSASTLTTKLGYLLGQAISTSTRLTTTAAESMLNDAQKEVVSRLYARKCWHPLRELQKETTYTLTGASSYNVYDVLSGTDYYGFVRAKAGDYPCRVITIEDETRALTAGEFFPTTSDPYLIFWGYDTGTGHGNLPKFQFRPASSKQTLTFTYLRNPTTMQSAATAVDSCLTTECDNAMLFWAAALYWAGDREGEGFSRFMGLHNKEVDELVARYGESLFQDTWYVPVV